jgi:CRP-like cAMP-binding protein
MLDPGPRSYSARAFSDLHLVEISHADFLRLHRLYPRLASMAHRNLARILGHRLAIANVMYYQKSLQHQG